ncbi:MAG: endonuclease MutS2 [Nitrospirae bacterium]|nr:endonuclease MutS2 [Nitrospirota bacterium]
MKKREALQILDFDKILNAISKFSNSEVSQARILSIIPLNKKEEIEKRFKIIQEIRRLSQEGISLKLSSFRDITKLIIKIRPEGTYLEPHELLYFLTILKIISSIISQLKERNDLPLLRDLTNHLTGFPEILKLIERTIDNEGNVLDNASSTLNELRIQIRNLEKKIKKRLEEIVRDKKMLLFLQDNFISQRSGRWVIPVRMDSKGRVPGVVHDISRSGETAFVEPLEIIGIANELENLVAEERAEVIRILKSISQRIRSISDGILSQFETIVHLDVLNSIAQFSDSMKMNVPDINNDSIIKLVKARHPLLIFFEKNDAFEKVVPLDLALGEKNKIMVITGPNAGGKTIAIKTVGLLLSMALSGIPVSCDSSSNFPIVNKILVDIGDEQSIENSLSTFSAHISNISSILEQADSKTVVLLDELGTGTDPVQGAAIACSILEKLWEKGSLVFSTTHIIDIAGFVHRKEGMINASMEFDNKTLSPLYRLKIGEPGQSYAFDIAKKYGMPEDIIISAKEKLGSMNVEFQSLVKEIRGKSTKYEEILFEVQKYKKELMEKERLLSEKLEETEKKKKEILKNTYEDALRIISDTKRRVNTLIEDAKRERKQVVKKVIIKEEEDIIKRLKQYSVEDEDIVLIKNIKERDIVFVKSIGYDAEVLKVDRKHNSLRVNVGKKEIEVPLSDVSYSKEKHLEKVEPCFTVNTEEVTFQLNIIGLKVDEALARVEPFLNHAFIQNISEVIIIHGVGTGKLLSAVRDYLKGHPLVKRFRKGELSEGGNGVTFVTMK